MLTFLKINLVVLAMAGVFPCGDGGGTDPSDRDSSIGIVDRTGKEWDITHAVKRYGMDKDNFNYGLGPNAITPVNFPEILEPGEEGYPDDTASVRIIGLDIDGEARAYPVTPLAAHEVVNDSVGGSLVAVTY